MACTSTKRYDNTMICSGKGVLGIQIAFVGHTSTWVIGMRESHIELPNRQSEPKRAHNKQNAEFVGSTQDQPTIASPTNS